MWQQASDHQRRARHSWQCLLARFSHVNILRIRNGHDVYSGQYAPTVLMENKDLKAYHLEVNVTNPDSFLNLKDFFDFK